MARAGELLDLGDTIGARRIVRRVLDRAAPELLGELADLAADLGLGEEDLSTAPGGRADVVWRRPPEGSAVRVRALPAPGLAQFAGPAGTWPERAGRRRGRDGGYGAASYAATRGGVDDDPERDEQAPGYTIDYDRAALDGLHAAVCLGCRLERTPADVGPGDGVCADCRADGLGRDPLELRCEAILAAAVRRGPWAPPPAAARCGTAPTRPGGRGSPPGSPPTTPRSPRPRAGADPHPPSPRPGHHPVTGPPRVPGAEVAAQRAGHASARRARGARPGDTRR